MWQFEEDEEENGSNGPISEPSEPVAEPSAPVTEPQKGKRAAMAKRWCFTWNNYPETWQTYVQGASSHVDEYIIGKEVGGQSHIPHLQGYLELKRKLRPIETLKWPKEIHWELAKGTREQNIAYCSKDGDFIASDACRPKKPLKLITEFRG